MKKKIGLTLLLVVLASCAPEGDPQVLAIAGAQLIDSKTQCRIKATGGAAEVKPMGVLDLLVTNKYYMAPVVINDLEPAGGGDASGPNGVTLKGAHVRYEISGLTGKHPDGTTDGPTKLPKVFVPASGYVQAASQTTTLIELVPPEIGKILDEDTVFDQKYTSGKLIAHVVIEGFMNDGTVVRSNEFLFPIDVCRACLVYYPIPMSKCCLGTQSDSAVLCFPGQDEGVSCDLACAMLDGAAREAQKKALLEGKITTDNLADYVAPPGS